MDVHPGDRTDGHGTRPAKSRRSVTKKRVPVSAVCWIFESLCVALVGGLRGCESLTGFRKTGSLSHVPSDFRLESVSGSQVYVGTWIGCKSEPGTKRNIFPMPGDVSYMTNNKSPDPRNPPVHAESCDERFTIHETRIHPGTIG